MGFILYALLFIAILLVVFKLYMKLTVKWNGSYVCLVGKTAIVTGSNTGVGYPTALDFAKRGARVILACRSKEKAEKAVQKIITATANKNVVFKLLDCASLQSVRNFAKDINANEDRLDILVNNAAILNTNDGMSSDGIQTVLQVNHVAGFLLTHLLIDKLKKSAPSRIVIVASNTAKSATLNLKTLNEMNTLDPAKTFMGMYSNSKLCNMLFTTELAKRLDGTGVIANVAHPGATHTDVLNNTTNAPQWMKNFYNFGTSIFFKTAEEGAQAQIYAAVANEVANISGEYFVNCERVDIYDNAKDPELARIVWEITEELAKLNDSEKIPNVQLNK